MNKPEIVPVPDHSGSIACPHCGEEFGIEDRIECERALQCDDTYRKMEQQHRKLMYELWEDVICPMCKRLNPQHEFCDYCHDREEWQALKSQLEDDEACPMCKGQGWVLDLYQRKYDCPTCKSTGRISK